MLHGRVAALALALTLAAGCSGGGSAPAPQAAGLGASTNAPSESSAARYILANATAGSSSRAPQRFDGDGDEDDGGWSTLQLPVVRPCGNGTYATDCTVWNWTRNGGGAGGGTRSAARAPQSTADVGTPPILNFCSGGPNAPFGYTFAAPVLAAGPSVFSLTYLGTHAPPIVTFATRWWNVSVQNSFAGTSTVAPQIAVSPALSGGASRGWLVFFTWSWPADILLVPYAIDEIQLAAGSSPLTVPRNGSAQLGAFDCLGRSIAAKRSNTSFGFSPNLRGGDAVTGASPLTATVYGGSNPSGTIFLSDDRGARTSAPVVAGPAATR